MHKLTSYRRSLFVLMALNALLCVLVFAPQAFAEEGAAAGAEEGSIWIHIIKSSLPIWGPLLGLMSIALVGLFVLLLLDLRMSVAIPPGFVDEFVDTVNKRRFKEAFEMARNDNSFLGRVLTAGMSRLQYGLEDARDAASNMLDSIRSSKEQLNNYTAMIGTLGPLIGLVGTVIGMIRSFKSLAKGGPPNPTKLSEGISEALSVTFLGIGLSVFAIFFNGFLRNRIVKLSMDTAHIADDLLTQMYHNSKKAGGTPGASTMGSAPTPPPPPGRGATGAPPV